jgi:hypothetical protein
MSLTEAAIIIINITTDMATLISRAWSLLSLNGFRLFIALIGIAAICWGITFISIDASEVTIDRIARRIVLGEVFKPETTLGFEGLAGAAERDISCRPNAIRSAAVIRVRLVQDAIAATDRLSIDRNLVALRSTIRRSLSCSPDDPFLWLVLYWVEASRTGLRPELIEYLSKSYELGPYEGWIGVKRNGLALAVFEKLPADLSEKVVAEFAVLLNSGFVAEMVANLSGPGWPVHDILVSRLATVKQGYREALANEMDRNGFSVQVPGVELREARPWNR